VPAEDFLVLRTIHIAPDLSVEIRVTRDVALRWWSKFAGNERLLHAAAFGHSFRLVFAAVRARGLGAGRWRASFHGGDRVDFEPLA
jgi:hypothetical protein